MWEKARSFGVSLTEDVGPVEQLQWAGSLGDWWYRKHHLRLEPVVAVEDGLVDGERDVWLRELLEEALLGVGWLGESSLLFVASRTGCSGLGFYQQVQHSQ